MTRHATEPRPAIPSDVDSSYERPSPLHGKRIALITNIPRPYREPLYAELNSQLCAHGGRLRVFYYSDPRKHLRRHPMAAHHPAYDRRRVRSLEFRLGYERVISVPVGLLPALIRFRPHAVISGTFGAAGFMSWLYCLAVGGRYIQWSGATKSRAPSAVAEVSRRILVRHAAASVTYGSWSRDYLVELGARHGSIVAGVNTVDTERFAASARNAVSAVASMRAQDKFSGVNLLYAGTLVPPKGLGHVLAALADLPSTTRRHCLHIVGDGPARASLERETESRGLAKTVHFWGSVPASEMPTFYALADVFVFPSLYDVWGLVVNEAMACGVPCIASPRSGVTRDLVRDGHNGLAVDPRDARRLSSALATLIEDDDLRARMGAAAAATIRESATIEHSAAGLIRATILSLQSSRQ